MPKGQLEKKNQSFPNENIFLTCYIVVRWHSRMVSPVWHKRNQIQSTSPTNDVEALAPKLGTFTVTIYDTHNSFSLLQLLFRTDPTMPPKGRVAPSLYAVFGSIGQICNALEPSIFPRKKATTWMIISAWQIPVSNNVL